MQAGPGIADVDGDLVARRGRARIDDRRMAAPGGRIVPS